MRPIQLHGMGALKYVVLSDTKVTEGGVSKLQKALPKVKVSQ